MFENIKADLSRYCQLAENETFIQKLKVIISNYGFHATSVYRFGKRIEGCSLLIAIILSFVYYPMAFCVRLLYGINISRQASIGKGLYIAHFGGVLIGNCEIGAFCSIHQQVKIESNTQGSPLIGNQAWMGAHTQILGPATIGCGATLGAGAVVTSDVGERCLALGKPARVINKDYDNSEMHGFGRRERVQRKTTGEDLCTTPPNHRIDDFSPRLCC